MFFVVSMVMFACTKANIENSKKTDVDNNLSEETNYSSDAIVVPRADDMGDNVKIIFLHHSTGGKIWAGGVASWFEDYNSSNGKDYIISQTNFPGSGYPWNNYPYDYWNIWIENAGSDLFSGQKTLEMLTEEFDVIIWKHCFPVSDILAADENPNVSSEKKTIANYKLQYNALKEKMKSFPNNRFLVWTGAVKLEISLSEDRALRTKEFFDWVRNEWDEPGDNIYLWDFYQLETEGGLYLKPENAASNRDSHPGEEFSARVAPFFCTRIVDVIKGNADNTSITGENNLGL